MKDLEGKVAFVTGAASGIGLGIAKAFAAQGMKVMMADIEEDTLEKAVADLRAANGVVEGIVCDVIGEEPHQGPVLFCQLRSLPLGEQVCLCVVLFFVEAQGLYLCHHTHP